MEAVKIEPASPARANEILSHWPKLIENFQFSPQEFYTLIEQSLAARQVPGLEVSRVGMHEGGTFSAQRTYLRLRRERLTFDICGAPFGTGFFVSSWFWEKTPVVRWDVLLLTVILVALGFIFAKEYFGLVLTAVALIAVAMCLMRGVLSDLDAFLLAIPVVSFVYERFFRTMTYYRIDLMHMYQQAVHGALMQVVDQITSAQGIAPMSELQRKPIMKELYRR